MTDPVVKQIKVPCSAADAYDVFVNRTASWWPLDKHSASAGQGQTARNLTIEPRVGGAVYETMFDGSHDAWGKVLECQPGRRFVMTWHPGNNKDAPTEVSVDFVDLPEGGARVTLTHSGWEAFGNRAEDMRKGYNDGWVRVFEERFADGCKG